MNVFPELAHARTRGVEIGNALTEVRKILSERERRLIEPVAGAQSGQLKALQDEVVAIEAQLKTMPTKEQSIAERQKKAREAYNELDKRHAAELQVVLLGAHAQAVATQQILSATRSSRRSRRSSEQAAQHVVPRPLHRRDRWRAAAARHAPQVARRGRPVGGDR